MQIAIVNSADLGESMLAGDHVRKLVPVPAEALSTTEQDTLLVQSGSLEKVATVRGPRRGVRGNRAWSMGGSVD